ncbi:MAG: 4Fe-4S binding protein, partial [Desulfotomaculaceae bacterium]|nr:4Fe-4S binding protein [Desulfotomaculaceae bacterium]
DSSGKAAVVNAAQCTACGKCITHCPDFAISIRED